MSEQAEPSTREARGLTPGFLVSFARRPNLKAAGGSQSNRTRFPHVNVLGLGDAGPDLIRLTSALSLCGDRATAEVVAECTGAEGVNGRLLERFASTLADRGFLVPEPSPPRWSGVAAVPLHDSLPIAPDERLEIPEGSTFVVDDGELLWFDHSGTLRLRLSADELIAVRPFGEAATLDEAWTDLRAEPRAPVMARETFEALVARVRSSGLLRAGGSAASRRNTFAPTETNARDLVLAGVLAAVEDFERAASARPGNRIAVVPVNDDHNMAPLSLGLLVAYAQELEGGRLQDRYDFVPLFLTDATRILEWADRPSIFLFSNYIWNHERNLRMSAALKAANPENLMVHGGPSTPKYTQDCDDFFTEHPDVDITVRGEGEATFAALLDALDTSDLHDLSALRDVEGLTFRAPDGSLVHTEDRDRIADVDSIPSPYLLGLFDAFGKAHVAAVVESNRGCPYGCTFCDWGSATLSRIRKFDMDRVKAELEWFSRNELLFVSLCDANFGILERDVEIAEHIAAMKRRYGYPKTAALNYAKNTMKHLRKIIDVFSSADLTIEPTVALQSTDTVTLKTVRRSNIKLEQYDGLADEFRKAQLPLATDLMMGLPGSTLESFARDLQTCTDRDIRARCNPTVLLPNSPMNDPAYREEHGIVARPHEIVKEAKTFTRADFDEMDRLRVAFYVFDNFGVLRHLARFVRQEVGVREVDFYDGISRCAVEAPAQWPVITSVVRMMNDNLGPPSSWALFLEEVRRYAVVELGVEDDSALDTAVAVQLAHIPAPDRRMPETRALAHDFAAWHTAVLEAREGEHRDEWERHAPRLRTFPPAELKVSDPSDVCGTMIGKPVMAMAWNILGWDMESPVARGQLVGSGT